MTHTDTFWRFFWIIIFGVVIVYSGSILTLTYLYAPAANASAAAVGVDYNPARDPYERAARQAARPAFTSDYFYQDALPLAFEDWSWGVGADWNSTEQVYEGAHALKVTFREEWAGVRLAGSDIKLDAYTGISLRVYPDSAVGDLYLELYDTYGRSLGRQSLGWYVPDGVLVPNAWNAITIPFENLMPLGSSKRPITGLSLGAQHLGSAFVDAVHLEKTAGSYPRWSEPLWVDVPAPPAPPIYLPYTLQFLPQEMGAWRTDFGRFDLTNNGIYAGPTAQKTTGSMSYIAGGNEWEDYRVDTVVYWGLTESISLLTRFADDANFISCAFSHYGQQVQMYKVKNGESTLLGSTPLLPVRADEPWKDAHQSASVQGNTVSCFVDDQKVLSYTIPDISARGSVGIETWTENSYDSPHTLESLNVTSL